MAIEWKDLATSFYNKASWDETVLLWKNSLVLGWYNSIVVLGYSLLYGGAKSQWMLGYERKINVLNKYEWYFAQPTKVLCNGEGKIDLEQTSKTTPSLKWKTLFTETLATTAVRTALEQESKAVSANAIATGLKTETYGTHVLNCLVGGSTENVLQKTITAEASLKLSSATSVAIESGAVSILMSPAALMLTAPIINIG